MNLPPPSQKWRAAPRALRGAFWILAYIFLTAFPLLVLLLGDMPKGGGYWWDFAMALGFGGLAIMGLQSLLTARFRTRDGALRSGYYLLFPPAGGTGWLRIDCGPLYYSSRALRRGTGPARRPGT